MNPRLFWSATYFECGLILDQEDLLRLRPGDAYFGGKEIRYQAGFNPLMHRPPPFATGSHVYDLRTDRFGVIHVHKEADSDRRIRYKSLYLRQWAQQEITWLNRTNPSSIRLHP